MANRRPIRAPRQGWRKGRRRPTKWIDCYSTGGRVGDLWEGFPWAPLVAPVANAAQPTAREIIAGDIDTAVLDRQEVTITRIVGDIQFYTRSVIAVENPLDAVLPPVVRLGVVVEEDSGESSSTSSHELHNLWNPTGIQTMEWMHLQQVDWQETWSETIDVYAQRSFHASVHLDIRTRRKLGKSDRCWLIMSYGNGLENGLQASNNWASEVYEAHLLRSVILT